MKRKGLWITIAAVLVVVIGVVLWQQQQPVQQEEKVIKIGAILPLTGPSAHIGEWQKRGIEIGVKDINREPNSNIKIEILFEDSKTEAKEGINGFNKLIDVDKVHALISSLSAISNPLIPLIEERKVPLIMIAVSYPGIASKSEWAFRNHPGSEDEAKVMGKYLLERGDIKTAGIYYINDDFGLGAYETFTTLFKSMGGKVVFHDSYEKDKAEFRSEISKAIRTSPDAIYVIGYVDASAILIKQLREAGYKGILACNMAMSVPKYLELVGDGFQNSYFTVTTFDPNSERARIKHFVTEYYKYGKSKPNVFAAMAYDAITMIGKVVQTQNTYTREDIKNGLLHMRTYEGLMGKLRISPEGNVLFPLRIAKYENGNLHILE